MNTRTYAAAGVSLSAGDAASRIMFEASRRTWRNRQGLPGEIKIGFDAFSATRFVETADFGSAMLGMNFDGVGTKVEVAERVGDHTTIAFDLFAMICDDAARGGAEPLLVGSILDCRQISIPIVRQLAQGMVAAAKVARVAVINGEVAELGHRIAGHGDAAYNWAGAVAWIGKRERMISGRQVAPGQAIVAVKEHGFRSNGLSLARKVLSEHYGDDWHTQKFGKSTLGRAVLEPSRIYTPLMGALTGGYSGQPKATVTALAHITGGGIPGKLGRALLPSGCGAILDDLFAPPAIMRHCQQLAGIKEPEAYKVWNMGNGLLIVTPQPEVVINEAARLGCEAKTVGQVQRKPEIRLCSKGGKKAKTWLRFPL